MAEAVVVRDEAVQGDIKPRLDEFLRKFYYNDLHIAAKKGIESVIVDFGLLDRFDPIIADRLLESPISVLKVLEDVVKEIDLPVEHKIKIRFFNLPERQNIRIRNLRAKHLGKFLTVDCIVKSASEVKPQIYEVVFKCPDCDNKIVVEQDENIVKMPSVCECGRRGRFDIVEKRMHDVRWLMVDEPFEITTGEQPGTISIVLKEDLTTPKMQKKTDPGNRIKVTGILKELPKKIHGRLGTKLDIFVEANYPESAEIEFDELEVTQEDEKKIKELASDPRLFEKIRASIAPGIYGYEEIKEALALQLFSGIPHRLPDGTKLRGNIHILITGDPGVGKTRLIQMTSSAIPRGRYVSGKGVTGAGLCTTYDTLVILGNGKIRKIGDLVEEKAGKMKKMKEGVLAADSDDLTIMALDQKDLSIKPMKIEKYWKIKSPKVLIKIKTRTGKEIKVTKDNPLPTLESGALVWKSAKNFKKGDYIACPRELKCNSDIFWDEIKSIETVEGEDYVYDLTVEKEHSFVANGVIIHNTASVIKNEIIGGWVLQAGALVLCNKGIIAIDEFDKMNTDDQIAMHEAMSVSTISIAKASIVATLPADTAVLAGANPKLGRFDRYTSIIEQINIPETLMSRFDLKFALMDRPDKAMDERLAQHIIDARLTPEVVTPVIDGILLRKYIAYARRISKIELGKEAAIILRDFYVEMRNRYTGEDGIVSITLRQYEALIRLAEASAKARLHLVIDIDDVQRAINLMKYSLSQLAMDEKGRIDIDKMESGVSTSQRNRIRQLMDLIKELQEESGSREAVIQDLKAEAEDRGIGEIDDILDKLIQEGMIYSPRPGFVRTA